ncbi:MAG: GNAT family N-acetyltransferase [Alsobacter sp.]
MADRVSIVPVESAADLRSVRTLCNDFLAWLRTRYTSVDEYYPPDAWGQLLHDLPVIHAPPLGGIWLAVEEGRALGTVMLKGSAEPKICEMKRLFVHAEARGRGLGRRLAFRAVDEARRCGYETMVFDTGIFHTEAKALYTQMGFRVRDPYYDCPEPLRSQLIFYEGRLSDIGPRD